MGATEQEWLEFGLVVAPEWNEHFVFGGKAAPKNARIAIAIPAVGGGVAVGVVSVAQGIVMGAADAP